MTQIMTVSYTLPGTVQGYLGSGTLFKINEHVLISYDVPGSALGSLTGAAASTTVRWVRQTVPPADLIPPIVHSLGQRCKISGLSLIYFSF